jgi:hypothetical protein
MSKSKWDELHLEEKLLRILNVQSHAPNHPFGRPFQTPYQIAITFKKLYPEEFKKIGKPLGGKHTGQQDSLTQYLAEELARRVNRGYLPTVEGRFLHRKYLKGLTYDNDGELVESSAEQAYDLSIYRIRD